MHPIFDPKAELSISEIQEVEIAVAEDRNPDLTPSKGF